MRESQYLHNTTKVGTWFVSNKNFLAKKFGRYYQFFWHQVTYMPIVVKGKLHANSFEVAHILICQKLN